VESWSEADGPAQSSVPSPGGATVAGRILRSASEGASLKKGDLVAQIDPSDYELRRVEAAAALAQAQAQFDLMLAGSRPEDIRRLKIKCKRRKPPPRRRRQISNGFNRCSTRRAQHRNNSTTRRRQLTARQRIYRARKRPDPATQRQSQGRRCQRAGLLDQSKARLALAEKALADCTVRSPMDGASRPEFARRRGGGRGDTADNAVPAGRGLVVRLRA